MLLPDGRVGHTRNGAFSTNVDGVLTTSRVVLQPEIALPDGVSQINISRDGITALVAGGVGAEAVGQLQVADFTNRSGLQPIGESFMSRRCLRRCDRWQPAGCWPGRIHALEASNVNVVTELVSMIETQRAYEVSSKSITSVDEMLRYISQNLQPPVRVILCCVFLASFLFGITGAVSGCSTARERGVAGLRADLSCGAYHA